MKCDNSCNELKILFCYQAFILFVLLNQLQEVGGNYGRSKLGPASSFAQNWVQSSPQRYQTGRILKLRSSASLARDDIKVGKSTKDHLVVY